MSLAVQWRNRYIARRPSVIAREARKARNVMPVRALTRKAFHAIRVLKPCWMMSPLAVSQYLPPGQVFDLVIFDEASQMRPADAIPALARARQVIVVGDDKQLPPTSFFDNAIAGDTEGDGDEERADLADYESILDRCGSVLQQRMLRWHYRSRDESLIAFSNHHFYDDHLVTFPTPGNRPGFGVRHVRVDATTIEAGTSRIGARHTKLRGSPTSTREPGPMRRSASLLLVRRSNVRLVMRSRRWRSSIRSPRHSSPRRGRQTSAYL